MSAGISISAVDYHTAGEPFRIVTGGMPPLRGATILDKRRDVLERLDDYRKLLVFEPRGHADMYGGYVVEPNDDGAHLGVIFFHNEGYSTACGHGTIALVTWAIESGFVASDGDEVEVRVDVPSGRVTTVAHVEGDDVKNVSFHNVPSFVWGEDLKVQTVRGPLAVDVSYGGAFYGSVDASSLGLSIEAANLTELIELGREIKKELGREHEIVHPIEPELHGVYGVIFYEELSKNPLVHRNVTVFADGEVDRSPCGSGSSARLALLHHKGELGDNEPFEHRGIVDGVFRCAVTGRAQVGPHDAVMTEIEGRASLTGYHHFVLEPDDEVGTFLLR